MTIYVKVGTGPGEYLKVLKKRSVKLGDVFEVVHPNVPGEKPTRVRLTDVIVLHGAQKLHLAERF